MDLQFTPEEQAFREEVRSFLKDRLPQHIAGKVKAGQRLSKADQEEWHAILNERGWLANHWPREYGGPGWGAVQKVIFDNECALAGGPRIVPFGVNMLGPVLIKFGNEQQKRHWLPRILSGQDWWCQGYSEPGAGWTWPRSRPRPFESRTQQASTTSSTARRPGPPRASTPT